jgi:hypothetical protein
MVISKYKDLNSQLCGVLAPVMSKAFANCPRGTMQYNQQSYLIYSSYSHQSGMQPDGYIKVQGLELTTLWSIGSSDEQSFCKLSTLRASTMTLQASGNCIIEW